MDEYQMIQLSECARCGERGYEKLATHGHCVACGYSPIIETRAEQDSEIPQWAAAFFNGSKDLLNLLGRAEAYV